MGLMTCFVAGGVVEEWEEKLVVVGCYVVVCCLGFR